MGKFPYALPVGLSKADRKTYKEIWKAHGGADAAEWLTAKAKAEAEAKPFTVVRTDDKSEPSDERHVFTGDEVAAMEEVKLDWLPVLGAEGWMVCGWSHLLSGFIRVGKTELVMACLREWLDRGLKVYYVTEENAGLWTLRLRETRRDWSGLTLNCGMGIAPKRLLAEASEHAADIVLLDSVRNLLQIQDENDNSQVSAASRPWVEMARRTGRTLLSIAHDRKSGGEFGEGVAGGSGMISVYDVILEVKRDATADNRRILSTLPRHIPAKKEAYEMVVSLDPATLQPDRRFRFLGSPALLQLDAVKDRLRDMFRDHYEADLTTTTIVGYLGDPKPSRDSVVRALLELAAEGEVTRTPAIGQDVQGKTPMWRHEGP